MTFSSKPISSEILKTYGPNVRSSERLCAQTWPEHCILNGLGVLYRAAREVKTEVLVSDLSKHEYKLKFRNDTANP